MSKRQGKKEKECYDSHQEGKGRRDTHRLPRKTLTYWAQLLNDSVICISSMLQT